MKLKTITIILLSFICFISCIKDNITEPEPEPGRRDYVWTIDRIDSFNPVYRIWGSSPTDIWAVSSGSLTDDIHHFDGKNWSTDGIFRLLYPLSIWGFSSNNVYIGGANGKIWYFNGTKWNEMVSLTKDGHSDIFFDNIWGDSPNDLYAFGAYLDEKGYANNSVIAHYNGSWSMLNTDGLIGIVERVFISEDKLLYIRTNRSGAGQFPDSTLIYKFYKGEYTKLYGNRWTKGLQADIGIINEEVYFILGNIIAKRINDQFDTILLIDDKNFYQRIWGRTSKDIFLLMTDGLAHYNGENVEYLFYFTYAEDKPWTQIYGAALFENEVFFIVYEPTTHLNLIYHGTLE